MNLEALIVVPQVTHAIRSRAIHVVRDRFAAPRFQQTLTTSAKAQQAAAPTRSSAPAMHTVKDGEFLSRIVRDHLQAQGLPAKNADVLSGINRVAAANGIDDPDLIHPGQRIDLSVLNSMRSSKLDETRGRGGRALDLISSKIQERPSVKAVVADIMHARDTTEGYGQAAGFAAWGGALGAEAELSSSYGYRDDPFTGGRRFHHGIDLAVPKGTTVHPLEAGEVVFSGWQSGYGRVVIVRHDNGVESVYGHASKVLVKKGQQVDAGDTIALSGSSGRSTGPHLHLEVRRNGRPFDPMAYLERDQVKLAKRQ